MLINNFTGTKLAFNMNLKPSSQSKVIPNSSARFWNTSIKGCRALRIIPKTSLLASTTTSTISAKPATNALSASAAAELIKALAILLPNFSRFAANVLFFTANSPKILSWFFSASAANLVLSANNPWLLANFKKTSASPPPDSFNFSIMSLNATLEVFISLTRFTVSSKAPARSFLTKSA